MGLVLAGLALAAVGEWLNSEESNHFVVAITQALSDAFIVTGAIGLAVDYFTGRDKDAADTARTRAIVKELAPDFTDAVVRGFAVQPDDLRRVATPEMLDSIATNVLSLRLGDAQFASELYADLRDQAIRSAERWYDVDVSVRVSAIAERDTVGVPLFDISVEWAYTTVPCHPIRRFACVSDRDEFHELVSDVPSTNTWFMTPRPGVDPSARESFELLTFSVDGDERSIRRSSRRSGQSYTASIGQDVVDARRPVRVKHLYRVVAARSNHHLYLEIAQPARDLSLHLDYSDTDIAELRVSDLVTSMQRPRISTWPEAASGGKVIDVEIPGWLLPKAGFTFVWTLSSEVPTVASATGRTPAA